MAPQAAHLVVVLLALDVHKVQLIDQAKALEQRQRAVDGGKVDMRIFARRQLLQRLGVQVALRALNELKNYFALVRHAHTAIFQFIAQVSSRGQLFHGDEIRVLDFYLQTICNCSRQQILPRT